MTSTYDDFEAHVRHDRWEEACALALELTRSTPDLPTAWFNLGVCLDETDQHLKAAEAFQHSLVLEPDEGATYRMLRSLLLADRHDALFEELRTYSHENPELVQDIAELEPFQALFETEPLFAALLASPHPAGVSAQQRQHNLATINELGFRLPAPLPPRPLACGHFPRFMPEIALRALSLACLCAYLEDAVPSADIDACMAHIAGRNYLAHDEQAILDLPRDQAQQRYGHIMGWFMERMLPLAWSLGFPELPPPDGAPIPSSTADELTAFIGEIHVFDTLWDWLARFPGLRPQAQAVAMEDLYFLAQVAVKQARDANTACTPEDFDPIFHGGVVLERWGSLMWALTPGLPLSDTLF